MNSDQTRPRAQKLSTILFAGAILPACGFFGWFSFSVLLQKSISFSRGDLVVCGLANLLLLVPVLLRAKHSFVARLALIQWSLLFVFVPAELLLRLAFRQPPTPWDPNTVREITLSVPFEGVAAKGTFSTNELGLRGRSLPLAQLESVDLPILCVGGSTTECFYNSDENAWPAVLERSIAKRTGGRVFVGNAGRGGHIARHHAWQLKHYRFAPRFRIVVVLCGWNDLSAALFHDPAAAPRDIAGESLTRGLNFTASAEPHTPFYRNLAIGKLFQEVVFSRSWNPVANAGWRAVIQDPYGEWVAERRKIRQKCIESGALTTPPAQLEEALNQFSADLEAIHAAISQEQMLIFITQPTLCRAALTEEQAARLWSCDGKRAWTAAATAAMLTQFNDVTRRYCREHNLTCVDAEVAMSGDPALFYDDCHFSDAGCSALADLVANRVIAVSDPKAIVGRD